MLMAKWTKNLLASLLAISLIIFILWPVLAVFISAFQVGETSFSLQPFWAYLQGHGDLIKQSLGVSLTVTLLTSALALSLALYYVGAPLKIQKLLRFFLLLSLISPPFISSLAYINLFGRRGLITYDLLGLRLDPYGFWGIVSMETLGFISFSTLLLINALQALDQEMIESSRSLGASVTQLMATVLLPMIRSSIIVVMLLTFIRSLADFSTPTIIGGNYSVLATEAYLQMIAYGNPEKAALINVIIILPACLAFYFYLKENNRQLSSSKVTREGRLFTATKSKTYMGLGLLTWLVLLLLLAQYGSIVYLAITDKIKGESYFTLSAFREVLPYLEDSLLRTLVYALISALVAVLLSSLLAYLEHIQNQSYFKAMDLVSMLPYIIPGSFFGLGYILAFSGKPLALTGTAAIVVLNMTFKLMPLSAKIMGTAAVGMDPSIFEASQDLGGHWYQDYLRLFLPLSKRAGQLALVNGFISSMTTFGSIIFLVYPGQKVLTLVLFDIIGSGKYRLASALSCILMGICIVFAGLTFTLGDRKEYGHAINR